MSQRVAKVQKLAQEVLGEAIQGLKDPRIGFATVTAVRVSADLRYARVYVSVMGSEEEKVATLRGLQSARSILRGELGRQVRMRYVPELTFELDSGPEEAQRLEALLRQIHEDRRGQEARVRYEIPDWDESVDAIAASSRIVLACHVNPDGDALGGLLGMSLGLRKLGKQTWATWGTSPVEMPDAYGFLPGADALVDASELPEQTEVFVALDCGSADRLGDAEDMARRAPRLINIDHHPGNTGFGHLNLVATEASSTAELVMYLLLDLGVELDRDIATCLYTGVVTDTGRFQYTNSSPETLRLAADLLSYGVPAPEIAREVFESSPFMYLKLVGRVLERARLERKERFVYSWIHQTDLAETGISMSETEKLVDLVRSTRDADVAAMLKEQEDGDYRVSLRSKGPSVGSIARANGGGGHELAAGFTAGSISEGVEAILEGLREPARGS